MDTKTKREVVAALVQAGQPDLAKQFVVVAAEDLLKQVQDMTDRNDHNGARLLVAKQVLKDKKLTELYQHVADMARIHGSMPSPLGDYRYHVLDRMLQAGLKKKNLLAYWQAM